MIGETVSHYRVVAALGSGGMGVVYRGEDTRLGRAVAIKFLPPQLGRDPAALERFRREARAASSFTHPGICTLYDIGETSAGQPFLVMELLEGETLQQRLHRGPLPEAELLACALQLAEALAAAHAKGIIHRDLKPANVFLTGHGQAKILDFGLAKITAAASSADLGEAPTVADPLALADLTVPGHAMGTVAYMSPEQALGKPLDARSDIFSLGAVLYEMAAGRSPFPGNTTAAVFDGILHGSPAPLIAPGTPVPVALDAVLRTAMEKEPAMRYQSAADLAGALRRLRRDTQSQPIPAVPAGAKPPAARRPVVLYSALVVIVAGALWLGRGKLSPRPVAPPAAPANAPPASVPAAVPAAAATVAPPQRRHAEKPFGQEDPVVVAKRVGIAVFPGAVGVSGNLLQQADNTVARMTFRSAATPQAVIVFYQQGIANAMVSQHGDGWSLVRVQGRDVVSIKAAPNAGQTEIQIVVNR